ncbi:MAG: MG2 domain-containing protein [Prevotellaceae bacterium]|nr:MG2 domain-containing protein [Prevotellaceae bacterium]
MIKRWKRYGLVWSLLCIMGLPLYAQSYEKQWKQVAEAEEKGLPQTVISLTDGIYRKASKEGNTAQLLKAYICREKARQRLTPDSLYSQLAYMEQWASRTPNPVEKALLHTLLAGEYRDYLRSNRRTLASRTEISEEAVSTDIRTWSARLVIRRIDAHNKASLQEAGPLLQARAKAYAPLVEQEAGSVYYRHDLYHLVARRAIGLYQSIEGYADGFPVEACIDSLYREMLHTYYTIPDAEEAELLTRLHYADWKRQSGYTATAPVGSTTTPLPSPALDSTAKEELYLQALDTLIARYAHLDLSAEAYLRKADCLNGLGRTAEALRLCADGMTRYAAYPHIQALENLREELLRPTLSVRMDDTAYPGDSLALRVQYRLLQGFTIALYATDLAETPAHESTLPPDFLRQHARKLSTSHYALAPLPRADAAEEDWPYQRADTTFCMHLPDTPGTYLLRVTPDEGGAESVDHLLAVSRLKVLTLSLADNQMEVVVVDAANGQPVAGATVGFHSAIDKARRKTLAQVTTDAEGKALLTWVKDIRCYTVCKEGDTASRPQYITLQNVGSRGGDTPQRRLTLLTDRALYRPGQTIHVKGVAYVQGSDTVHVVEGERYELQLLDVNRKEVSKQSVETNAFGSFSAEFVLPSACLNGNFLLRAGSSGSVTVRVEEYKRPTFEIGFDPVQAAYRLGDKVELTGTVSAYNGVALQEIPLAYSVTRLPGFPWRSGMTPLVADTVRIDAEGRFAIPILLTPPAGSYLTGSGSVGFAVNASVTDETGETVTALYTLAASTNAYHITHDLPAICCKEQPTQATFQVMNGDGQPLDVEGICRLIPMDGGAPVYEGRFLSGKLQAFPEWSGLPSGKYRVRLSVMEADGQERGGVTDKPDEIYLFSTADTRPAAPLTRFVYERELTFDKDQPAELYYGTSCPDVYLLVDVFDKERRLESHTMQLGDTIVHLVYPYKEAYGQGVSVLFTFVKAGEVNSYRVELRKRQPDRTLHLKWAVFRDRLHPGDREEWKLSIETPQGTPADAELLALLYDASLDGLYERNQSLAARPLFYLPYRTRSWARMGSLVFRPAFAMKRAKVSEWLFDHLYEAPMPVTDLYGSVRLAAAGASYTKAMAIESVNDAVEEEASATLSDAALNDRGSAEAPAASSTVERLRTDFSETAFFYPHLRTDDEGNVAIAFTLPQSLTRWNFRSYAHTRDMMTGSLDTTVVAAKEFMLTPDMPRFVRMGDKTTIAARIDNLTEDAVTGKATLTLFDPLTDKTITTLKADFTVAAGRRTTVSFGFSVDERYAVLGVRMIADGGSFSDGEQRLLAVLDNRAFITETLLLPIRGEGTRTFSLDSLFNRHSPTATDRRLTLEFTANPAWYALLALPSLSRPASDNALSLAAAYYADCVAGYIIGSHPRVKTMVDAWQAGGQAEAARTSPLAKNQELKELLLAESPWAAVADNETERMAGIARLFDTNDLGNRLLSTLTRLQALQGDDGSWSWYKGMAGNRTITTTITEWLLRLPLLTGTPLQADALTMERKAMNYLHRQALNDYLEMKKQADKKGNGNITEAATEYLYLVALSGEAVPKANEEACRYWLSLLPKLLASDSVTGKAHAAYILYRAGRVSEADAFIASLLEHLVQEEEMGAHFAFQDLPYISSDRILAAHVAAMEALHTVGGHETVIEEMKGWLLKQKQATAWNAVVTTADAVYALLCQGDDPLENQGAVSVSLDNHVVATLPDDSSLPGIGYIKREFTQDTPETDARTVTVRKQDGGIAWGALYAQYLTPMADVRGQGSALSVKQQQGEALSVERQLYVERVSTDGNRTLQPLTASTPLALGDKVISRLVIRVDRAMDFLQLKARHAACLEPVNTLSGYRSGSGLSYYQETEDAAVNCFFDHLGKGTYVIELPYRIARRGVYEAGIATLQCAYAPEFSTHSGSETITVVE